ncbi:amino acid ABC transporter substrate-binding protein [Vulcanibacillus modesticaldus]|uniref:Amino acid ABC transporter substrate-binding protein n=1 Tax=Vulcanibacillus modesticaldus TaxID=337097 RepID=A0A1D2YUZ0_9BACI|nr:basic amino acid ABC transporter substrate-binding protein [Vulcanibacillus modesticaldus]OEF99493.1 amino acid ABC transporter substrate-binding protein [Vulcanibacillus modesticaldus]
MGKGLKIGLLALILIGTSFVLIACGNQNLSVEKVDDGEQIYILGTDATYPPFENLEDGEIVGFDIDIVKAVAEEAGIKIEVKNTGWDPLFEGINREQIDAGIAAITITEKRKQSYDFTSPYFEASQLIIVPNDSDVNSLKDLEGKKIGVQTATTGDFIVQEAFGKTYQGLKGYDDILAALDDLQLGRIDAVVADNVVLLEYLKVLKNDSFKLVSDDSFEKEYYGIIVKKGNDELLEKLNEGLSKIKDNGKYDEIYRKYFAELN